MMYALENGETVRVRTCNDHILIVLSGKHSGDAKLNIEGTDWLLIVMPEIERTPGKVIAYLVPTKVAADASRQTHSEWLATNPNTKGNNTTWNLWFREDGPPKANDFARKWRTYRVQGASEITQGMSFAEAREPAGPAGNVKAEVEMARQRISKAAGVSLDAVKITIQFGA
jgi:hypothetical protein